MPSRHARASTAQSAAAKASAVRMPWVAASTGKVTADSAAPSGCAICRMPIAVPRCDGGYQPDTTRPEAEFTDAAAQPAKNSAPASATAPLSDAHAATPVIAAVEPRPNDRAARSPKTSTNQPHAMSVTTMPAAGIAAISPAAGSDSPVAVNAGMRKGVPMWTTEDPTAASVDKPRTKCR